MSDPPSLEERLRALEDRAAIAELISVYANAVARRDREAVLACFTPDGRFDVGPTTIVGRDRIRDYLKDLRPGTPHLKGFDSVSGSTPNNSNLSVVLDGDAAYATSTAVVFHAGARDGRPIVMVRGTEYQDELQRTGEGWRFSCRRHRTIWEFEAEGTVPTAPPKWDP